MKACSRQQVAAAFGTVARTARNAAGFSQQQLGDAADVGRTYILHGRSEGCQPTLHVLLRIAAAVDMDPGLMVTAAAISSAFGKNFTGFLWEPKLTSYTVRAVDE